MACTSTTAHRRANSLLVKLAAQSPAIQPTVTDRLSHRQHAYTHNTHVRVPQIVTGPNRDSHEHKHELYDFVVAQPYKVTIRKAVNELCVNCFPANRNSLSDDTRCIEPSTRELCGVSDTGLCVGTGVHTMAIAIRSGAAVTTLAELLERSKVSSGCSLHAKQYMPTRTHGRLWQLTCPLLALRPSHHRDRCYCATNKGGART